jgi:hypothetical protein
VSRNRDAGFQTVIAGGLVGLMLLAFVPTYFVPLGVGRFDGPPILHLHGLLFFAWPVLFLAQSLLAARGRYEWHRKLGAAGLALAAAMVVMGLVAIASSMRSWAAQGLEEQARAFSIIAFSGLALFAVFVAAAIASVRRPDRHQRLMLLATLAIMQAASGRLAFNIVNTVPYARPGTLSPPSPELAIGPHLACDLLVLGVVMAYDWRRHRRLHPVYLLGGTLLVLVQTTRHLFVDSVAWRSLLDVIVAFA